MCEKNNKQTKINGLEIVNRVELFYNRAWRKLLITLGLFGFVVTIIMPYILQRIQLASFKETEYRLKEEIRDETKENVKKEIDTITKKFDESREELVKQINKAINGTRAELYGQLGTSLLDKNMQPVLGILFQLVSARDYIKVEKDKFADIRLDSIISLEKNIKIERSPENEKLIEEIRTVLLGKVAEIREELTKRNKIAEFKSQLMKVEEWIRTHIFIFDKPEQEPNSPPEAE